MVTFAVLGHNEAADLPAALALARSASHPGDTVLFVDSGSTDASAAVAAQAGATVLAAPRGKGRAFARLYAEVREGWIVCLDADVQHSLPDLAARLRASCDDQHLMVVGQFDDDAVLSNTWAIYEPLEAALFPSLAGAFGTRPLSGFRALRCGLDLGELPPGFGLEAHLNVTVGTLGPVAVTDIGPYRGPFRYKPTMGREIGDGLLDAAVALGRLSPRQRPAFDAWVDEAVDAIAAYRGRPRQRQEFRKRLDELARRPIPDAHPSGPG